MEYFSSSWNNSLVRELLSGSWNDVLVRGSGVVHHLCVYGCLFVCACVMRIHVSVYACRRRRMGRDRRLAMRRARRAHWPHALSRGGRAPPVPSAQRRWAFLERACARSQTGERAAAEHDVSVSVAHYRCSDLVSRDRIAVWT